MEYTSVQKLARVLRVLVIIVFVCCLLAQLLIPGFALLRIAKEDLRDLTPYENPFELPLRVGAVFLMAWRWLWGQGAYAIVMAVFLWLCGICTAVILWQAKKVLDNIIAGELFSHSNGHSLKKAAMCSFVISAASLLWVVFQAILEGAWTLLSLSTLLFPIFFLAALLFLVMSALFRQAAEMKAENDLTI